MAFMNWYLNSWKYKFVFSFIVILISLRFISNRFRKCNYEIYVEPFQRGYKRAIREEYSTRCGHWKWRTCVKTRYLLLFCVEVSSIFVVMSDKLYMYHVDMWYIRSDIRLSPSSESQLSLAMSKKQSWLKLGIVAILWNNGRI